MLSSSPPILTYYYKVRSLPSDDSGELTVQVRLDKGGSDRLNYNFDISQNYPNPFNPSTRINFSIPEEEKIVLKIYDIMGKEIKLLLDERMSAGSYSVDFDGSSLASGIYFYSIQSGRYSAVKKMLLLK